MNACGCKACGGAEARAETLAARRFDAMARWIWSQRGQPSDLANRSEPVTLYSRLILPRAIPPEHDPANRLVRADPYSQSAMTAARGYGYDPKGD